MTFEEATKELDKRLQGYVGEIEAGAGVEEGRDEASFYASDKSEVAGHGVLRVDVLLTAIRLVSARITFRTLPGIWKSILKELLIKKGGTMVGRFVARRIANQVPIWGDFAGSAISQVETRAQQSAMEKQIREEFAKMRKQMNHKLLKQNERIRGVKRVQSRNKS